MKQSAPSADEDDRFQARLEHDPRFQARIAQARESIRSGKGVRLEDLSFEGNDEIGST
jgi:hypothetical protein